MRTLKIAVVEDEDQLHESVNKFLATKHGKGKEPVLFIYNIGNDELSGNQFAAIFPAPLILCVFNCDADLVTKEKYGKDYLTANADAMIIAQQMVGVDCEVPTFYNFFKQPKKSLYASYKDAVTLADNGQPGNNIQESK